MNQETKLERKMSEDIMQEIIWCFKICLKFWDVSLNDSIKQPHKEKLNISNYFNFQSTCPFNLRILYNKWSCNTVMVRKGEVLSRNKPHGYFTIYTFQFILSTAVENVVNTVAIIWSTLLRALRISTEGVMADIWCITITTRLKEKWHWLVK